MTPSDARVNSTGIKETKEEVGRNAGHSSGTTSHKNQYEKIKLSECSRVRSGSNSDSSNFEELPEAPADGGSSKKLSDIRSQNVSSRREELLLQLKVIEDAIAKRRSRMPDSSSKMGRSTFRKTYVLEKSSRRQTKPKAVVSNVRRCHKIKRLSLQYAQMLPLHELWQGYMGALRRAPKSCYLKADYHGCLMRVSHARNATQIGISGMVIMETRLTFMILTKKNRVVTIPKAGSVFQFLFDDKLFTVIGDNFFGTAAGRVQRKFKSRSICPVFLDELGICKLN
ncbi:unnamed protein product [Soboliphyme baturini]|uniref:Ribonuclease P protein subunit p29 n=1 Tax=Soboliphyme baturini TaxID=241478 RepID=A0A183IGZ8_9BILA|nr:unnamed protein product [Soboliphyme baturini]